MIKYLLSVIVVLACLSGWASVDVKQYLLPQPKKIEVLQGQATHFNGRIICKNLVEPAVMRSVNRVKQIMLGLGYNYPLASVAALNEKAAIELKIDASIGQKQGYTLQISNDGILLTGNDAEGLWNGVLTLEQLSAIAQKEGAFPMVKITDWPDFERRGVMLDISRDKVPTMASIYKLVDQLAKWKINEFQLYTEHTFAYQNHKKVWENASPMTAEQVIELDAYCKERFIDLVPNQNSFGHMRRWLKHKEYVHLAECPKPAKTIWGMMSKTSLSPVEPGSLKLVEELFNELLPNFSSEYVNIGCDETVELGCGKSKAICKRGQRKCLPEVFAGAEKVGRCE
jgi:N-acetyl-beta-hexosaminidase